MKSLYTIVPLLTLFLYGVSGGLNEGQIDTWEACEDDSDCKTRTDKCCDAYKKGYNKAWLCGPDIFNDEYKGNSGTNVANYTVPSGTTTYEGYSFQCYLNKSKGTGASIMSLTINSLIALVFMSLQ